MSGAGAQHLERRQGIYGLRVKVPEDIRPLVGMVEVRRSLRTYDPFRARLQSAVYAARLVEVFRMIKSDPTAFQHDAMKAMISACFRDFVFEAVSSAVPGNQPIAASPHITTPSDCPRAQAGITLAAAIDTYLEFKQVTWTPKTHKSRTQRLDYLKQYLGAGTSLRAITADDVRSVRDGICRFRRRQGAASRESFVAKQTENAKDRIEAKTAILIFEPIKAFFRWCKSEQGYIPINPAEDVRLSTPKQTKKAKSRRPFTASELKRLFCAPPFTGSVSKARRLQAGAEIIKDGRYWIPILGYYTGSRLGELVQLHVADVCLAGPAPYIDINENGGSLDGKNSKHVKSTASVRKVPLHPDLLELGFASFVAAAKRRKGTGKRLFPEIPFGADGQASTTFSKWFGRFMGKVGLTDPTLVFHSFRHSAEDAFRNAGQQQYVIDRIIGHSDGATSASYGDGIDLEVAYEAVKAMKLKVRLPELFSAA